MSFLLIEQVLELAAFASIADKEARSDLARGFIKDENDYTANFTGALRRIINSNSTSGLAATSFLLPHSEERETGADAAIILSRGKASKIAIFEAKWPRFSNTGYSWDYDQTASGVSHYSDQLKRQRRWSIPCAVFEMYYCEFQFGKQPRFLDENGSSCIWHEDAYSFMMRRTEPDDLWTQTDLENLHTENALISGALNISGVMTAFGLCQQGKPISMVEPLAIGREFQLPRSLLAITATQGPTDPSA